MDLDKEILEKTRSAGDAAKAAGCGIGYRPTDSKFCIKTFSSEELKALGERDNGPGKSSRFQRSDCGPGSLMQSPCNDEVEQQNLPRKAIAPSIKER